LAFVVVELQSPGHSLEHRLRRTREVATLEAGVVVDAHPCEHGDLLAPEALHPTYSAAGEQPSLLRADPRAAAGQEVPDISAVIHDPDAKTQPGDQPGPASTRITRSSQALTRTGSVRRSRPLSLTEVLTPLAHHHHHCTKYPGVRPRLASRVGGADGLLYSYPTAVCGVLEMHAIEEDDSLVEVGPFVDVSRAGHILGWKPGLSNVQALLGTYDWYLVHRDDSRGRGSHASRPVDQRALGVLKR
jgi:hypothetical protein